MNPIRSSKRLSGSFVPTNVQFGKPSLPPQPPPAGAPDISNCVSSPLEDPSPAMQDSRPPSPSVSATPVASETRKEEHDRSIRDINDKILALQQSVDHKLELIRHLIASREVAIAHEAELSRIDQAYADEAGRKKVLERVESFAGGTKGKEKEEKGVDPGKQKKKLISYAKRGTVKRTPVVKGGQPVANRRLSTYEAC